MTICLMCSSVNTHIYKLVSSATDGSNDGILPSFVACTGNACTQSTEETTLQTGSSDGKQLIVIIIASLRSAIS